MQIHKQNQGQDSLVAEMFDSQAERFHVQTPTVCSVLNRHPSLSKMPNPDLHNNDMYVTGSGFGYKHQLNRMKNITIHLWCFTRSDAGS